MVPLAVALAGLSMTALVQSTFSDRARAQDTLEVQRLTDRIASEIQRRMGYGPLVMHGIRAAAALDPHFGQQELQEYVQARRVDLDFPGLMRFGIAERVPLAELAAFEKRQRDGGAEDFRVRSLGTTPLDHAWVISQVAPAAQRAALGLDLTSETARRRAVLQALRTGDDVLSEPLQLRSGPNNVGFLQMARLPAPEGSRASPRILYVAILERELLSGVAQQAEGALDWSLSFRHSDGRTSWVHGEHDAGQRAFEPHPDHLQSRVLMIQSMPFELHTQPNGRFSAHMASQELGLIWLTGTILSLALAALAWQLLTMRARAEDLAASLTERLRTMSRAAQSTSDAVLVTDRALRIGWVNTAAARIAGRPSGNLIGRHAFEDYAPGAPDRGPAAHPQPDPRAQLEDAAALGTGARVELKRQRPDGSTCWVEVELQPSYDRHGTHDGWVLIESDITARRAAREELLAAQEQLAWLAVVAQRTGNAVLIADAHGLITWVNDACAELLGHPAESIEGRAFVDLVRPAASDAVWERLQQAMEHARDHRFELRFDRPHDRPLWLDVDLQPVIDAHGHRAGFIAVCADVSQIRADAQALAEQQARLHQVVAGTGAGTWQADVGSRQMQVNAQWAALLGHSLDEIAQDPLSALRQQAHPADWAHAREDLEALLSDRSQALDLEMRVRHQRGHWIWVHLQGRITERDDHARVRTVSGLMLDVTHRKSAQLQLARERQRLDQIIAGTGTGTWEWNLVTQDVRINDRFAQMLGHTVESLGPLDERAWQHLVHPEDGARADQAMHAYLEGRSSLYEAEMRLRHRQGHWVWVLTRAVRVASDSAGHGGAETLDTLAGIHLDISERKNAERTLRASQWLLDRAGRLGGIGGWFQDRQSGALQWTAQACRIHDLPPEAQPTPEQALDFVDPSMRAQMRSAIDEAIASGQGWDIEVPVRTATGRSIWVRSVGEAEYDEQGVTRVIGALQDVTERRRMEDALRQRNELLGTIVERMPCAVAVFDRDYRMIVSNQQYLQRLALPPDLAGAAHSPTPPTLLQIVEAMVARGDYGTMPLHEAQQLEMLGSVDDVQEPRSPTERMLPDGTVLEVRHSAMPGGGQVTTLTDITARRAAEDTTHRIEEMLRAAIDAVDAGFVMFDAQDRLVFWNDRYGTMMDTGGLVLHEGLHFEDIVRHAAIRGQACAQVQSPESIDEYVRSHVDSYRAGGERLLHMRNGHRIKAVDQRMPDGTRVGFRFDITEQVRAAEQAQAASQAKSQFLAGVSDEILMPMNAILGMLTLLQRSALTMRQREHVRRTEGAARSLLGLLNDILDYAKVEAGSVTLEALPLRVEDVMRDLAVVLPAAVGIKPLEVVFDLDPSVPAVLIGDAARLHQVLLNLTGNAIKFTPAGHVVIRTRCLSDALDEEGMPWRIPVRSGHARIRFEVADTGVGLPQEALEHVFDGFAQGQQRQSGGSGLGLSICQRLVQLMDSRLNVRSVPGQGSTFSFELDLQLPVADEAAPALPAPSVGSLSTEASGTLAAPASAQRPLRVAIADDDAIARESLGRMATQLGWEFQAFDDAASLVAAAQAAADADAADAADAHAPPPFDLVLLDWQMPGLDGWSAAQQLRQSDPARRTRIVLMSRWSRDRLGDARGSLDLDDPSSGIDALAVKPLTRSMLQDACDAAFDDSVSPDLTSPLDALPSPPDAPGLSGRLEGPGPERLVGMRILIVDDNAVHRELARERLQSEGAVVQIAENGQLGIEAISAMATVGESFDVVLMDMQMPVMDGFAAITKLRERWSAQALPIIAVSVNTSAQDRRACAEVGANGFVALPLDRDTLLAQIERVAGRGAAARAAQALPESAPEPRAVQDGLHRESAPTPSTESSASSTSSQRGGIAADAFEGQEPPAWAVAAAAAGIHVSAGVARMGGHGRSYRRIVEGLIAEFQDLPAQADAIRRARHVDAALERLHTLRGVAGTVGTLGLADQVLQIERRWRANRPLALDPAEWRPLLEAIARAQPLLARLASELEAAAIARETLHAAAQGSAALPVIPDSAPQGAATQFQSELRKLAELLRGGDMAALDACDALQVRWPQPLREIRADLETSVTQLDFEAAATLCESLLQEAT